MLSFGLISFLIAVPLFSYNNIPPKQYNRIAFVMLLASALLSINVLYYQEVSSGISIYNGLFQITTISLFAEAFMFTIGALLVIGWVQLPDHVPEYALMVLFSIIGSALLISSNDFVSMFLAIELQSFAVYVLSTLYKSSQTATAAGLKYFLLGGLSSALILLGTGLIYRTTGTTQFEDVYQLISVSSHIESIVLGLMLIGVGFIFKIGAAPFHNWAPDVYDGTTIPVTSWLSTMPKIAILVFILELTVGLNVEVWRTLLLVSSLISLIVGTVLGLTQTRIKRLLTFSTISHVGFLLLALAICTEESIEAFIFYLAQYSITNVCVFLVLISMSTTSELGLINEIKGIFYRNPLLSMSLAIALFSIAGIPPLIGFFAKQMVLYSSMHMSLYFISLVAIVVSVISASYYLRIVQVMYFNKAEVNDSLECRTGTSHIIAILTIIIVLFTLNPNILFNACTLMALSLFNY